MYNTNKIKKSTQESGRELGNGGLERNPTRVRVNDRENQTWITLKFKVLERPTVIAVVV